MVTTRGRPCVVLAALLLVTLTTDAAAVERRSRKSGRGRTVHADSTRPRSASECDLPGGREWFGSTERCLQELCAGENVTNAHTQDREGRIRRNPCYGRDPYELGR
jgi:hypothetical protein